VPIVFALIYILCHGMAIAAFHHAATAISFAFLIAAPILAAAMCIVRCVEVGFLPTRGWSALALGMLLWAGGMALNMHQQIFLGNVNSTPGDSMLLYILYGVPLTFAIASADERARNIHVIDGAFAVALGYLYFVHTFSVATVHGASEEGVASLRLMFDLENVFIALFAVIRYAASSTGSERPFFRALSIYAFVYLVVAGYINHLQSDDVDFGDLSDVLIDVPFLTLFVLASTSVKTRAVPPASRRLALFVQACSPLMMPVALLAVSGFVMSSHFALGMSGVALAVVGYGVRSTLLQVRAYEARDQSNDLARMDVLTGVPNRRQFDEYLFQEWHRARRAADQLALLLIDVDNFKLLNDTQGHQKGDDCLRAVAQALYTCVSGSSGLVARYGGEEFAALLPSTSLDRALEVAECMRATVEGIHLSAPAPFDHVTISLGVGFVESTSGLDPNALVSMADKAMYRAKKLGKNQVASGFPRNG
jgi:diguanylate cyclase (GGDEF)-like protein